MTGDVKPGWRTTEYWLTVAADVAATVLLGLHRITPAEWAMVTGGTSGVYQLARSLVKHGASSAAERVHTVRVDQTTTTDVIPAAVAVVPEVVTEPHPPPGWRTVDPGQPRLP